MPSLYDVYMSAVGGESECTLDKPGPVYVAELLSLCGRGVSEEQVREVYAHEAWSGEQSFTWWEFQQLAVKFGLDPEDQEVKALGAAASLGAQEEGVENVATSGDEAAELAALVDLVAQRASQRQFPCVLPKELKSSEAVEEAELVLQFVRQSEAVQLQSFLDHKYEVYRQSCPAEPSISEKERRMEYAMECHYIHVHEFLCAETLRVHSFRHRFEAGQFIPLVSPSALKQSDEKIAAASALRKVVEVVFSQRRESPGFMFFQSFDGALWAKWSEYESMAKYTDKPMEEVFRAFLLSDYYVTMADVIEQMVQGSTRALEPAFPVTSGGASPEEQQDRSAVLAVADAADAARVDAIIQAELDRMLGDMAPELKSLLPEDCHAAYREKRYFSVLAEAVGERLRSGTASSRTCMAKVQPEEGCEDAEEVDRRRALLKLMSPIDVRERGDRSERLVDVVP